MAGVLATGGGVSGPVTAGTLDTTGTHPGIAACEQASDHAVAGSQTLAGLAPTQLLPRLVVDEPGVTEFPVAPGVHVFQVEGRIALCNQAHLHIVLDPATDAVVFNARAFSMTRSTRIFVVGGDDTKVMINLPGSGPSVVLKRDAWAAPAIFAPERTMRIAGGARFAAMYAQRVRMREAFVDQVFDTCASPGGAFLNAAEPL